VRVLFDGQVHGALAQAVGAALYEAFLYGEDGTFLSASLADYSIPTACEIPAPLILHREIPSPVTPLDAKGVGEGNSMSTPVCIAKAVADALDIADLSLPLTPAKITTLLGRAGEAQ
jgi:2-furoyl-CoA dehydrogenase large subunit